MPIKAQKGGNVPASEVDHIIEAFKTWDESGTGTLSREDLSFVIRALNPGLGDADLEKLFAAAASDGLTGNQLKYEDFVTWLWAPAPGAEAEKKAEKAVEKKAERKAAAPAPPPKEARRANPRPVKKAVSAAAPASPTVAAAGPAAAAAVAAAPASAGVASRAAAVASSSSPAPPATLAPAFDPADEERRSRGLWEGALKDAIAKGSQKHPAEKVERYFTEVQKRLTGEDYVAHVRNVIFCQVDSDKDGKVSFGQVASTIGKSLQFASDMISAEKAPVTREEIRAAFDAHDTLRLGRGVMGVDEFLTLMRYLQVRVAEAAMPMSQVMKGA